MADRRLRGQFLIAAPHLKQDPNFHKTLVLIVEHGPSGAMGLVMNRPSTVLVSHALAGHIEIPDTGDLVYCGGPVEPAALFVLHSCHELSLEEPAVCSGVYLGSSPEIFEQALLQAATGLSGARCRVFMGCAGWGPGQLENELARCDWRVIPADAAAVFADDPYALYDDAWKQSQSDHRLIPDVSPRPELN